MKAIITFTIAATAAWLGVYCIRLWATRRQMLDRPNDRSMHAVPTPTGGGAAIAAVFLSGLLLQVYIGGEQMSYTALAFGLGAFSIATISWIDDVRPLGVGIRLCVHALAAIMLLCMCAAWQVQTGWPLAVGSLAVAFFWLVGMTNAYNFMDGVDGMAAGVAVVAGLSWFVLATLCGATLVGSLGLLLAAASGGFLLHNRPPARIFMGDVGSAFLGFSFGSLALIAAATDWRLALAGAMLVWPFIYDTLTTFTRRLIKGENVFSAHREHLFQQLCLAGWSHGSVSTFYAFLALSGTLTAAAMLLNPSAGYWIAVVAMPALIVGLWTFGRFQTTPWDNEPSIVNKNHAAANSPCEATWIIKIRFDDHFTPKYPSQASEQPTEEPLNGPGSGKYINHI